MKPRCGGRLACYASLPVAHTLLCPLSQGSAALIRLGPDPLAFGEFCRILRSDPRRLCHLHPFTNCRAAGIIFPLGLFKCW